MEKGNSGYPEERAGEKRGAVSFLRMLKLSPQNEARPSGSRPLRSRTEEGEKRMRSQVLGHRPNLLKGSGALESKRKRS